MKQFPLNTPSAPSIAPTATYCGLTKAVSVKRMEIACIQMSRVHTRAEVVAIKDAVKARGLLDAEIKALRIGFEAQYKRCAG